MTPMFNARFKITGWQFSMSHYVSGRMNKIRQADQVRTTTPPQSVLLCTQILFQNVYGTSLSLQVHAGI